jgi:hypothetical protein
LTKQREGQIYRRVMRQRNAEQTRLAPSGAWLTINGYCDACKRFLCYGVCWWCEPETRPSDFEQHLEEVRNAPSAAPRDRQ